MKNTYKNLSINSLNPLLGFGWNTKTSSKKETLYIKNKKNAFKNEFETV
ncbi:hypothetical protein Q4Q39_04305 [Flavivirga amylovorans]|uniref:Uncharacterized protein n=1 Tax=Flavivirga amylovorans TaxID=870486 RepID=A0ABT8WYB4_9FLAO|nr:hypothetical protein [Flavivirga amylovorans]MDO5986622.1 hypothetical protein [Flavivirga amylovorans]